MTNLFICGSALQCLIVEQIIEKEMLERENLEFFYYTDTNNEIINKYYNKINRLVKISHILYLKKNQCFI